MTLPKGSQHHSGIAAMWTQTATVAATAITLLKRADLVQLSSKMPSQVTMEKMSIQSEKAVQGLETANGLLDKHAKEINALKQAGEKELGNLDVKVSELNDASSDAAKKVASLEESIKSTKRLVDALDGEVTSLKKRHAESVATSAQN